MNCSCATKGNQFYYIRKEDVKTPTGLDAMGKQTFVEEKKEYLDSFSLDKVIRSIQLEDNRRLVLLNDIHERLEKTPQFNTKRDKITGYTKERNTFQSEIFLSVEESEKFVKLTNIE